MTNPIPHPTQNIKCDGCKHFLKSHAQLATMTQGGLASRASLLQQGLNVAGIDFRLMGPCTAGPGIWQLIDSEHWCGHYQGRDSF